MQTPTVKAFRCESCGANLPADHPVCEYCGSRHDLPAWPKESESQTTQDFTAKRVNWRYGLLLALAVAAGMIAMALAGRG